MEFDIWDKLRGWIETEGFVRIEERRIPVPVGTWQADSKLKELGMYNRERLSLGVESYCLRPMTKTLGISVEDVKIHMDAMREVLRNTPQVTQDLYAGPDSRLSPSHFAGRALTQK